MNVALGAAPRRFGFIDYGRPPGEVPAGCRRIGLALPRDRPAEALPLRPRPMGESPKAPFPPPQVLSLRQPAPSLTAHEVRTLFDLLRGLRAQGLAILYISHRLNEVLELCEWVTVLKDGTRTADQSLAGSDPHALVRLMVGRQVGDLFPAWQPTARDEVALNVRNLRCRGVRGIDLTVRRGEILGVGGLLGQGQEEALLALYGAVASEADRFTVAGGAVGPTTVIEAN